MNTKKPRNIWHIFLAVTGISVIGWYINTFPPSASYVIATFLVLFFISVYSLLLFILNNVRRSFLISLALTGVFTLRAIGLRDVLYTFLFLAALLLPYLYLTRR